MSNPTMGEIISTVRKEKGMTQKELADRMHVTDKAVSKWERNLSSPDINTVPHLAQVLGVSVEELLNGTVPDQAPQSEAERVLDIALKAVPLAMGIGVVVTAMLKSIDLHSAVSMLGIGLICLCIQQFRVRK